MTGYKGKSYITFASNGSWKYKSSAAVYMRMEPKQIWKFSLTNRSSVYKSQRLSTQLDLELPHEAFQPSLEQLKFLYDLSE